MVNPSICAGVFTRGFAWALWVCLGLMFAAGPSAWAVQADGAGQADDAGQVKNKQAEPRAESVAGSTEPADPEDVEQAKALARLRGMLAVLGVLLSALVPLLVILWYGRRLRRWTRQERKPTSLDDPWYARPLVPPLEEDEDDVEFSTDLDVLDDEGSDDGSDDGTHDDPPNDPPNDSPPDDEPWKNG